MFLKIKVMCRFIGWDLDGALSTAVDWFSEGKFCIAYFAMFLSFQEVILSAINPKCDEYDLFCHLDKNNSTLAVIRKALSGLRCTKDYNISHSICICFILATTFRIV